MGLSSCSRKELFFLFLCFCLLASYSSISLSSLSLFPSVFLFFPDFCARASSSFEFSVDALTGSSAFPYLNWPLMMSLARRETATAISNLVKKREVTRWLAGVISSSGRRESWTFSIIYLINCNIHEKDDFLLFIYLVNVTLDEDFFVKKYF